MAEEEADSTEEQPAGGGVLKKYGPLAAIVLLAQVILAWVLIQVTVVDKVGDDGDTGDDLLPQQTQVELQRGGLETDSGEIPYFWGDVALAKLTANPAGTNAERFVVISLEIGLVGTDDEGEVMTAAQIEEDPKVAELLPKNLGLIKSVILGVMRAKTIDELDAQVQEDVLNTIESELNQKVFDKLIWNPEDEGSKKKLTISDVIFTEMIIQ